MLYETGDVVQSDDNPPVPVTVLISFAALDGSESCVALADDNKTLHIVEELQETILQA